MPASPAETVRAAYIRGREEAHPGVRAIPEDLFAPSNLREVEIRSAVTSWTQAQFQHEHTSFYGTFHVRAMRAYWLGRLRGIREKS